MIHLTHILEPTFKRQACSGLNQCLIGKSSGGNEGVSNAQFSQWVNHLTLWLMMW